MADRPEFATLLTSQLELHLGDKARVEALRPTCYDSAFT